MWDIGKNFVSGQQNFAQILTLQVKKKNQKKKADLQNFARILTWEKKLSDVAMKCLFRL